MRAQSKIVSETQRSPEGQGNPPGDWIHYRDLEINTALFKKGIVVIKPSIFPPVKHPKIDDDSFSIGSREFLFGETNNKREVKKTSLLLNKLEEFCYDNSKNCNFKEVSNTTLLFNKKRRQEMFASFSLPDSVKQNNIGFYIYPWLSAENENLNFSGFKKFVTAGCIFGGSIQGLDQYDAAISLIKHDHKFHPTQQIKNIAVNLKTYSAYESAFFSEFEKLAVLITSLSNKDKPAELYYHLPYYDYILFGVELFIHGRITLSALDQFFEAIFIRKEEYTVKLTEICKAQNILLTIESPFENLFGVLPESTTSDQVYVNFILNKLSIPVKEIAPETDDEKRAINEKNLAEHCKDLLKKNSYHPEQQKVWQSFSNIDEDKIDNLDQMYKLANAAMLALACNDKNSYETCSLLPLSEKQIQVSYATINKKLESKYPAVFCITTLDPLISYDNSKYSGLLFYFSNSQNSLVKLINKKELLDKAHENIVNHAEGKEPISLHSLLNSSY